jgi:glucose/arabinose dehydrogenase
VFAEGGFVVTLRRILFAVGAFALALSTTSESAQAPAVALEPLFGVAGPPTAITHAGDSTGRLFVATQDGNIVVYDGANVSPFLTVPNVDYVAESGLLGLAFHPDYRNNGFFYVFHVDHEHSRITRYQVSGSDPNRGESASARLILSMPGRSSYNHRGGALAFGPDGYLYIATGDVNLGGTQGTDQYDGKILRIDVNTTDGSPYRIPLDNPFVGRFGAVREIWATGLRQPWRLSFDRSTGDLFIADVGEDLYEELNFQRAGVPGGQNYGWDVMEGPVCRFSSAPCTPPGYTLPVLSYNHNEGCAVIGGYRYRGTRYPTLEGRYVYADHCNGKIWGATDQTGAWTTDLLASNTGIQPSTFGEDEQGELYIGDWGARHIYRIKAMPRLSIAAWGEVVPEGGSSVVAVGLSEFPTEPITVRLRTVPGTAGVSDFEPVDTVLTFGPGELLKQVSIATTNDAIQEPIERFSIQLSDAVGALAPQPEVFVEIQPDDDPAPTVSVGDCTVVEDDTSCAFIVRLSLESGFTATVQYDLVDGTATWGVDYEGVEGQDQITFLPGQTTATVAVAVKEDSEEEATETFTVRLRSPNGVYLADDTGTGTIIDDDEPIPTTAPEIMSPAWGSGLSDPIATFDWGVVPLATRYRIALYREDGVTLLFERELDASSVCTQFCRAQPGYTLPIASYRWDVTAGGPRQWGPRSEAQDFYVTVSSSHPLMTVAGTGDPTFNGDERPAFTANVNVSALAVAGIDDIVLAGPEGRIRRVSQDGVIRTIAGDGTLPSEGCGADGVPAAATRIPRITALAVDAHANIYFATTGMQSECVQVRRIDASTGLLSTIAGLASEAGYSGDGGPARQAALAPGISGLVVDVHGNVFISDTGNRRVRRVDAGTAVITTVAGNGAEADSGDGGPAVDASFVRPRGLALDAAGTLYVADEGAHRVRRVDVASGTIVTAVGTGVPGFDGDWTLLAAARLSAPRSLAVDRAGNLWISDAGNNVVRHVDWLQYGGNVRAIAGSYWQTEGPINDGRYPWEARLTGPADIALDTVGNLYINDAGVYRVRRFANNAPIAFAGPDQEVEDGQIVRLEGAAWDADAEDWAATEWYIGGQSVSGQPIFETVFPVGTHEIALVANDFFGGVAIDTVRVVVRPDPPAIVSIVRPRDVAVPAGSPLTIEWTAADDDPIGMFEVLFSADGGASYVSVPECSGIEPTARTCTWNSPGPLTEDGRLKVEARDPVMNTTGFDVVSLRVVSPVPPPGNGTGLRGDYYNDKNFQRHVVQRIDPTVNFDWGNGRPAPGVRPNTFSVRWTGSFEVRYPETFTFHTLSDEGVRLWIDGQLVIDHWEKHTVAEDEGTIALEPGRRYTIRLDHWEEKGPAVMKLLWSSPSQPKEVVPQSQLYP